MSRQLVRFGATAAAVMLAHREPGRAARAQQPSQMVTLPLMHWPVPMMQDSTHAMKCPMMSRTRCVPFISG